MYIRDERQLRDRQPTRQGVSKMSGSVTGEEKYDGVHDGIVIEYLLTRHETEKNDDGTPGKKTSRKGIGVEKVFGKLSRR